MSLSIRPTDALVHRLLQQSSRAASEPDAASAKSGKHVEDYVNISSDAKQKPEGKPNDGLYGASGRRSKYQQEDLEARLLSLYSHSKETKS